VGTVQYSIWIGASPGLVWDVYTNLDRIPEWQTGDPRVEEVGGQGDEVGTIYTVRRGPGASRTTVTEAVRPSIHASRTSAPLGLSFDLTTNLVPENGGTRLQLRAQTHWPNGLGLVGRVVEFFFMNGSEANRELGRLKVLVEREAEERPDRLK
jgi:uncharacterized protein YndB with AHSA1/START domain